MSDIQAISLDLWGTVICNNPAFKIAAANSISRHCVSTPDEIIMAIRQLKDHHNGRVEEEGHAPTSHQLFESLCQTFTVEVSAESVEEEYTQLFFKHPPFFLSADTPQLIKEISQVIPLHLLSNTMMICHTTLSKMLHEYLGIGHLFQSMTFSDNTGYSKPHTRIFEECFKGMACEKTNVMHLGDNVRTDYDGASRFGFRACLLSETKPVRSGTVDLVGSLREFRDRFFPESNSPTQEQS